MRRLARPSSHSTRPPDHRRSRASRDTTDNSICVVTLHDGTVGFGEGVPRPYVTGETIETAWQRLQTVSLDGEIAEPFAFVEQLIGRIADDAIIHNACRAALELAVLDACGRARDASVAAGLAAYTGTRPGSVCTHSAVLDRKAPQRTEWLRALVARFISLPIV